jgi:prepilin-type processing-associated H-X9-DG protein
MDLMKIFKSDKDGIRRSHVKNLVTVAMADGHVGTDEWELLIGIAQRLGMSEAEITEIRNNPEGVNFVPPKKYEERVQQLRDLVSVMTSDSLINLRELELCRKISLRLDILPQMVDEILEHNFSRS